MKITGTLGLLLVPLLLGAAEPTPRQQVLRLVPAESSVVFVVQNLRDTSQRVAASPFAKWAAGKFNAKLAGNADAQRLQEIEAFLEPFLGVKLNDIRDDIFGDCLAFAYEPGQTSPLQEERGLLLVHARDPAKLKTLIDKLNSFQKTTGDLKEIRTRTHQGVEYIQRDRGNSVSEYYLIRGNLFAFAVQESAIQGVIDRLHQPLQSPVLRDLDALKLDQALLACWLSPRALDHELKPQPNATPEAVAGLAQTAAIWKAVDRCAIYLRVDAEIEIGAAIHYAADAMPAEIRGSLGQAPAVSSLWSVMPRNTIVAAAVTAEATTALNLIASFLPAPEQARVRQRIDRELAGIVGKEKASRLLNGLGPHCGVWLEGGTGPWPRTTAVVQVRDEPAAMRKVAGFYVQAFVVDHNRRHDDTITFDDSDVATLSQEKLFPPGVSPSFTVRDGFLIAGSQRDSIDAFKTPTGPPTVSPGLVARFSASVLREHLKTFEEPLAKQLSQWNQQPEATVKTEIRSLRDDLEAIDSAEITIRGDSANRVFALKVQLIQPLKSIDQPK